MRFKRVDKSTVRCIVSQDEIEERGLKIEDLIKNGDKAQEFLNEVVDMAEEEIGFKMTSGIQAVQAAFLPNHDVVFTFSDKAENIGMDRALDHLKDMMTEEGWTDAERVDEIRGMTGQNQADAFAKLLREIQDRQEEELQESEAADREDPSAEAQSTAETAGAPEEKKPADYWMGNHMFIVFFGSMDHAVRFCRHFPGFAFRQESLYKTDDREYALILDIEEIGKEEMAALSIQACEYGTSFLIGDARAREIEEHAVCILPKQALYRLSNL